MRHSLQVSRILRLLQIVIDFVWLGQVLLDARAKHSHVQQDLQEAFQTYTASLELERQARQEVFAAEQRRDDISELHVCLRAALHAAFLRKSFQCSRCFRVFSHHRVCSFIGGLD